MPAEGRQSILPSQGNTSVPLLGSRGARNGWVAGLLLSFSIESRGSARPPPHPAPQDQLKQLQEILSSLSLQEEKTRVSQHRLDQQLNSEAQRSSSLVAQLRAMVAEREAKVRQLELEIGQLSVQVSGVLAQPAGSQVGAGPPSTQRSLSHFLFSPPVFPWAAPSPTWPRFGSLLPSGSPAHAAHTFPL